MRTRVTGLGARAAGGALSVVRAVRRTGRPKHNALSYTMTGIVAFLVVFGLLMVLSTSSVLGLEAGGSPWSDFGRQLMWAAIGLVAFFLASRMPYRNWRILTPYILAFSLITLLLVLIPGIGMATDGARRWLRFGPFAFQPSEVAKLAILLYASALLDRRARRLDDLKAAFIPIMAMVAVMAGFIMMEPDLDTTVEIALIAGAVMWVGGVRTRHLLVLGGSAVLMVFGFVLMFPWRLSRLLVFLHPTDDPQGAGYQTRQSLIHIANGGITGVGPGEGRSKWSGGLPAVHTDFIFSAIGEEFGLLGALVVLAMFVALAISGFRVASRMAKHDRFAMLLAGGATSWICFQAVINTAMATGIMPVTGTPLPFISVGGSSLVSFMIAGGILVNLARHCEPEKIRPSAMHPATRGALKKSRPALT